MRVFQDPTVGAASGRDVSVGDLNAEANASEAGYVGYEMGVRALETRLGGHHRRERLLLRHPPRPRGYRAFPRN